MLIKYVIVEIASAQKCGWTKAVIRAWAISRRWRCLRSATPFYAWTAWQENCKSVPGSERKLSSSRERYSPANQHETFGWNYQSEYEPCEQTIYKYTRPWCNATWNNPTMMRKINYKYDIVEEWSSLAGDREIPLLWVRPGERVRLSKSCIRPECFLTAYGRQDYTGSGRYGA